MRKKSATRRDFLAGTIAGVAGTTLAGSPVTAVAGADPRRTARLTGVYPPNTPQADSGYSPGILAEGRKLIFVSGCGPHDRKADMETQMRQALEAISKVLENAGASMKDIVNIRAYFVNIERDLPVFRKVRKEYLAKPYPAATAVGVIALASPDLQVEIEAMAVI